MAVAPIINLDGETVGVLAAQANIDSLSVIMLERAGLGESGEAYLISDRDQRLMTASIDPEWQPGDYLFSDAIIKSALEGLNGSGNYSNYKGVAVYGAYRSLPELGMSLIIEQEQTEVLAPIVRIIIIIAGTSILATLFSIVIALLVTNRITQPIAGLANTAEQIATGNLNLLARVEQEDEIGALAVSFNTMTTQLRQTLEGLEGQVRDRTAALEQRSAYLQASADISRAVSSVLDPDQLIQQVVELIKERFNLYYVGLFLLDEAGELAVLRAGTGEAGRVMIQKGHQLKVGSGMIGWSIANQRSRIAQHAELDASRLANPNLPDTRSEAAIPLRSRGRVIGALTIQSDRLDAFDEATIVVFETMGDQVAVALDNARLFRESQQTLESLRQAYGEITREGWKRLLKESPELGYRSDASGRISQVQDGDRWLHEMELAFDEERSVQGLIEEAAATSEHDSESQEGSSVTGLSEYYLSVPLKVRENLIGVFTAYKPIERGGWNAEEIAFMEEVVDDISVALESARFFSEAQARAETERLITEVSGRIRQTLDIDTVLQVAAREMQQALDLAEVEIHLGGVSDVAAHGAETPRPTKSSDGGKEEV
jgi:GAF domain-containing protein/HAMP domain-containing protein